ncbi:MAG: AAA family ATPase [Polyangia bacterium]
MQIQRLTAINFRCFEQLTLDLKPGFNLLIGDNGAGKTAVLDALMLGLGSYFLGFRIQQQPAPSITSFDARRIVREVGGTVDMQAQYPVLIGCDGLSEGAQLEWLRARQGEGNKTTIRDARQLSDFGAEQLKRLRTRDQPSDLPLFGYYGTERLWVHLGEPRAPMKLAQSRAAGYRYCLARESNIRYIAEWLKQRTLSNVQEQAARADPKTGTVTITPDVHIRTISQAVCSCIPGARELYYSVKHKGLFLRFFDQRELPFYLLSDGVRGTLQLVADLAWRAVALNPHLGAAAPSRSTGVVLIDELDLALHPSWQVRIINDLVRVFPRLQFVATTHSPLILAGAKGAHVLRLEGGRAYPQEHVYGQDSNTVLTDVMDGPARPPEMVRELDHIAALVDAGQVQQARWEITRLEQVLGPQSPDLVRLRTALEFLHPPRDKDRGA